MNDWISPAQQTSLLVILGLLVVWLMLRQIGRYLRRLSGKVAILSAQEREMTEPDVGWLPAPWGRLRAEVEMANRVLNRRVFERARELFLDYYTQTGSPNSALSPAALTAEYAAEEFLLVVDEHGQPAKPDKTMLESFQRTAAQHPLLQNWFREEVITDGVWAGLHTLAAARWLCHLVGLRHVAVEIFIDPPDLPGHTLVRQMESDARYDDGEGFDLPCAVHVSGAERPEAALEMELQETCRLGFAHIDNLRLLCRYNAYGDQAEGARSRLFMSNEHRLLYRARLKPGVMPDGLALVSLAELRVLMRESPKRVSSRLHDALGYYSDDPVQNQEAHS